MDCLIIAAGVGSRLCPEGGSKPLTRIAGTPLIEHVIRGAQQGGASRFTIVTGHEAERLESFLADLSARLGVAIAPVRLTDWSRPNGYSVLAGARRFGANYLLMMADHLFEPAVAARICATELPADALRLAIDRRLDDPQLDLDDATKVHLSSSGDIIRIGKALDRYEAVDTGMFLAGPSLPLAIEESLRRGGSGSLSEGVQWLADCGRAHTMDIGQAWWMDVDDARSLALAEQALAVRQPQG